MKTTVCLILQLMLLSWSSYSQSDPSERYEFSTSIDILLIANEGQENRSEMNIQILYSEVGDYYGVEFKDLYNHQENKNETIYVFDLAQGKVLNFMSSPGKRLGIQMELDRSEFNRNIEEQTKRHKATFTRTGKKKDILGFKCEQIIIENLEGKGDCWVSNKTDLEIGESLNATSFFSSTKSYKMPQDYPEGAIMEMNFAYNNGEKLHWIATAINKNIARSVIPESYEIITTN